MPRISGVELPDEKRIEAGLAVLYGIGRKNVFKILSEASIQQGKKIKDLTSEEVARLQKIIDQYLKIDLFVINYEYFFDRHLSRASLTFLIRSFGETGLRMKSMPESINSRL